MSVTPELVLRNGFPVEHWCVEDDGLHNLTTDLIRWKNAFYLVYSKSPWHIGSTKSRIILMRSTDGFHWDKVREFQLEKGDIRDPKLSVINDRLYLFVLRNEAFFAKPSSTLFSVSSDGEHWSSFSSSLPAGWLFWRPKTFDGKTWYVTAYWKTHGTSKLFRTNDGTDWQEVSTIYEGDFNDETDFEFLPDGSMYVTARLEKNGSAFGHPKASTLIAIAEPPYTRWSWTKCFVTRLDGPNLFSLNGKLFALGRHHPGSNQTWNRRGSFLGTKRTALYLAKADKLVHLFDFPSTGDTGYPGAAVMGDSLYVSYYTSPTVREYRWIHGMFKPSQIRLAKLSISSLARAAETLI